MMTSSHLSPQNGYDPGSCAITLTIYAPERTALNYFNMVYDTMRSGGFEAHFYWEKHFNHKYEKVVPNLDEFANFRKQMDLKGISL